MPKFRSRCATSPLGEIPAAGHVKTLLGPVTINGRRKALNVTRNIASEGLQRLRLLAGRRFLVLRGN